MNTFIEQINGKEDWAKIYQSIPAFKPLVEFIFKKENLPLAEIENLTPGTNAVFKVGEYVIKIFAPVESGYNQASDLQTELFAMRRVNESPQVIVDGFVDDKYLFNYMIMEYIHGVEVVEAVKTMTDDEKVEIGRKLRQICDSMNTPCEPFHDGNRYNCWDEYPEHFKAERLAYIQTHDFGEKVFVHGDLCLDNMLLKDGELYILDFADAVHAPVCYEHALVAFAFEFDPALMKGFFTDYTNDTFVEMIFNGMLLHDFGGAIVRDLGEFDNLESLRNLIIRSIKLT